MNPEDIWAPGILDEEREHSNRWADHRDDDLPSPSEFADDTSDSPEDSPW